MPQREMGFRPYSRVYPSEEVVKLFPIGCLYPAQPDEMPKDLLRRAQTEMRKQNYRIRQNFVADKLMKGKFSACIEGLEFFPKLITEQQATESVRGIQSQRRLLYNSWDIEGVAVSSAPKRAESNSRKNRFVKYEIILHPRKSFRRQTTFSFWSRCCIRNITQNTYQQITPQSFFVLIFRWHFKSFESETDFTRVTQIKLVNKISGAVENCQVNLYFWTGIQEKIYSLQSKVF